MGYYDLALRITEIRLTHDQKNIYPDFEEQEENQAFVPQEVKKEHEIKDTKEEKEETKESDERVPNVEKQVESQAFKPNEAEISFHIVREESCGQDCFVGFTKTNVTSVKKAFIRARSKHVDELQKLVDLCSQHASLLSVEQSAKIGKDEIYLVTEVVYPIDYYFKAICEKERPESLEKWWKIIEKQFWIIFRDIIHGLMDLFKSGSACGHLSFNTFVTPEGRGRILPSLASPKHLADFAELTQVMNTIIGFPFQENVDRTFIPYDLQHFLDYIACIIRLYGSVSIPAFLMDHPYFWTVREKIQFSINLRKLIKISAAYGSIEQMLQKLNLFSNWTHIVTGAGAYGQVLGKPNEPNSSVKPYNSYIDIIRFFYAVYTHINEKEYKALRGKKKLTNEEIEEALTGYYPRFYIDMFECLCECGLRNRFPVKDLMSVSSVYSEAVVCPIKA